MSKYFFKGQTIESGNIEQMSAAELLPIFNDVRKAMKMDPISRFSDTKTARRRTHEILAEITAQAPVQHVPAKKAAPTAKPEKAKREPKAEATATRASRGTNLAAPGHAPLACREGSKQALLVDLLSKPAGASMNELLAGLSGGNKPWTEATVRSGFGWDMKQKGYGVRSEFDEHGTERFHLVLPVIRGSVAAIPPHTPLKGKPKHDARQSRLVG